MSEFTEVYRSSLYQCSVIEESLSDKSTLDAVKQYKFTEYVSQTDDPMYPVWHINGYMLSYNKLLPVMDVFKEQIKPDWYIHAFNERDDTLFVILKGKIFKLPCRRDDLWEEMIAYGESMGLERRWTENIPLRV